MPYIEKINVGIDSVMEMIVKMRIALFRLFGHNRRERVGRVLANETPLSRCWPCSIPPACVLVMTSSSRSSSSDTAWMRAAVSFSITFSSDHDGEVRPTFCSARAV